MKCNLCGCEIEGWGNNPAPLIENEEDRCCDLCNGNYVIPARIYEIARGRFTDSETVRLVEAIRKENDYDC